MCLSGGNVAVTLIAFRFLLSFPGLAQSRSVEPRDGADSGGYLQSLICLSLDFPEVER